LTDLTVGGPPTGPIRLSVPRPRIISFLLPKVSYSIRPSTLEKGFSILSVRDLDPFYERSLLGARFFPWPVRPFTTWPPRWDWMASLTPPFTRDLTGRLSSSLIHFFFFFFHHPVSVSGWLFPLGTSDKVWLNYF